MTVGGNSAGIARRHLRMPHVEPGMTVGLFGGSFDPPHDGHRLVAETALTRLGLDQLWWIVTPQNPLKAERGSEDLARRITLSLGIARDPRIRVTAFEAAHSIRYSADTIRLVLARNPRTRFVWIMGADNLKGFHRWQRWRWIASSIPIAVIDRPGSTLSFLSSIMARAFAHARLDENDAPILARRKPPAWTFIHGPRSSLSSTAIRRARDGAAAVPAGRRDPQLS
jgi:nicotinate-nucleotide adenylyltransferase